MLGSVTEGGNHADGEFVEQAVVHVGERSVAVRVRRAHASSAGIVEALRDHVVEIGLEQEVALRQRRGVGREERAGPPGVGEGLVESGGGRGGLLSGSLECRECDGKQCDADWRVDSHSRSESEQGLDRGCGCGDAKKMQR